MISFDGLNTSPLISGRYIDLWLKFNKKYYPYVSSNTCKINFKVFSVFWIEEDKLFLFDNVCAGACRCVAVDFCRVLCFKCLNVLTKVSEDMKYSFAVVRSTIAL